MTTVNGLGACCISGRIDEGEPKGNIIEIRGVKCYQASPIGGSKERVVVISTDVFGFTLPNVRLIADSFASQGYYAIVPDLFEGSEPPADLMDKLNNVNGTRQDATFWDKAGAIGSVLYYFPWFIIKNGMGAKNLERVKDIVNHVRGDGAKYIAVQGYCWGGKIAAQIAQTDLVDVAIPSHAGGLSYPKDFEDLKKPCLFQWAEFDTQIPLKNCESVMPLLEQKGGSGKIYPGVHHGFAVRGNLNDEIDKKQRLQAFDDAITFLNTHFKL